MSINFGRTNALQPPIATKETLVSKEFSLKLRPMSLHVKLKLARYFVTKRFIRKESLSTKEEYILYSVVEDLQETKDKKFLQANWTTLGSLFSLVKLSNLRSEGKHIESVVKLLSKNKLFFSPRAYLGLIIDPNFFCKRLNRSLRKNPPPERFIGVGYKDTGHRKEPHLDGSPSWQEVSHQKLDSLQSSFLKVSQKGQSPEVTIVLPTNSYCLFECF